MRRHIAQLVLVVTPALLILVRVGYKWGANL